MQKYYFRVWGPLQTQNVPGNPAVSDLLGSSFSSTIQCAMFSWNKRKHSAWGIQITRKTIFNAFF
jgi:hypothetical protein